MERGIGSALCIYMLTITTCGFAADYESIAKRTRHSHVRLKQECGEQDRKRDCNEMCKKVRNDESFEHQEKAQEILECGMKFIEHDDTTKWSDVRVTLVDHSVPVRPIDRRMLSWVDATYAHHIEGVGEIIKSGQEVSHGTSPYPVDEEDPYLVSLHLNFRLMSIGVRQKEDDSLKVTCRGCGDPRIPYAFLLSFDFNNQADKYGYSFMTRAVACNDGETVYLLLRRGASINKPDARNITPLEEAHYCNNGRRQGHYSEMIALLRECGAVERLLSIE